MRLLFEDRGLIVPLREVTWDPWDRRRLGSENLDNYPLGAPT